MSKNDWYNTDNWYEPSKTQAEPAKRERKKRRGFTPVRVFGIIVLVVIVIAATSIAASQGSRVDISIGEGFGPDNFVPDNFMPDDFADFFDSYYDVTQTDIADIDIPRTDVPMAASVELVPHQGEMLSLQEIYAGCAPTIVAIKGQTGDLVGYNWGTGVILSEDGLVLTNTHVIDGCSSVSVTLYDDREFEAKLVGADSISDIALLKIEAKNLPAAQLGESSSLMVGDPVAAIGNPLGEEFRMTLTDGIISGIERGINYNGHSMNLLQTNTAINEGNSGGPLFNMYGQVIGVTNMKMMSSYSSIEGIGFAIPSSTVKSVVDSLLRYGEVRGRPSIGITVGAIPENAASHYELPDGLYVSAVAEGSDAEKQGIKAGDVITHANSKPVRTTEDVNSIKNELQVGDKITFTVWREGKTMEISVLLMDTNDIYNK